MKRVMPSTPKGAGADYRSAMECPMIPSSFSRRMVNALLGAANP